MSASDDTRRWQAKRLAAGLCQWCGCPRGDGNARYCHLHLIAWRRLMRDGERRRRAQRRAALGGGGAPKKGKA